MATVSKEMWIDWKRNPVTMDFLGALNDKREQIKEGIAEGQSGNVDLDIGRSQGLKDALKYALVEFDYIEFNQPEEEANGTESSGFSSDSEG